MIREWLPRLCAAAAVLGVCCSVAAAVFGDDVASLLFASDALVCLIGLLAWSEL